MLAKNEHSVATIQVANDDAFVAELSRPRVPLCLLSPLFPFSRFYLPTDINVNRTIFSRSGRAFLPPTKKAHKASLCLMKALQVFDVY